MPKIVIIGSGPGLGLDVARFFGMKGWKSVLVARNAQRLGEEADILRAEGCEVSHHACDINDIHKLDQIIRDEAADGGIDILNYNAVTLRPDTPFLQIALDDIRSDMMVGLGGAIVAARAAVPDMQRRGGGTILFSGGELGVSPWHLMPTAGAVKAGLRNFALCLTRDPACAGLRVAYVNIDAHIVGPVGTEIAQVYLDVHERPAEQKEWDVIFRRPYVKPWE